VLITFNTLVNNKTNITQGGRKDGLGASYITVVNNLIQGGGPAASISGPYNNGVWEGNIIFNTSGAGDMPVGSYKIVDPRLEKDASGEFHLATGSPCINAATGNYVAVETDMDAQKRVAPFDIGADEISREPVKARMLNPVDVGATTAK
jgi:poly(beta-D-mannuronate) lyase